MIGFRACFHRTIVNT